MSTLVNIVVPFKDPTTAKSRLSPLLDANQRVALAWFLLEQTLTLLQSRFSDTPRLVVTNAPEPLRDPTGSTVLRETSDGGLNRALGQAAAWSVEHGYASTLFIPADIAAIDPSDLSYLLARPRNPRSLHLCPSLDGGTNAFLATPPDAVPFRFGIASCAAHLDAAATAGVKATVHRLPSLARDVDTPEDLAWLPRLPEGIASTKQLKQWNSQAVS